jgi:hypothetical protein
MKFTPVLLGFASMLLLVACSNFTVDSDYTPGTDFESFKSYSWYSATLRDPKSLDFLGGDIFDKRVRYNIDQQLQAKGFVLKSDGAVDFKVNYDVLTEDRQDIRTYNTYSGMAPGFGYYGAYGYGGMGMGTSQTQVVNYKQGQLIIDIILPENEILVWRGTAEGRIPKNEKPEQREKGTQELIAKILANFPPQKQ